MMAILCLCVYLGQCIDEEYSCITSDPQHVSDKNLINRIDGVYHTEPMPKEFSARTQKRWEGCDFFFNKVPRSSVACGDCYGQSAAGFLGTILCTTQTRTKLPVPPATLSTRHAITCLPKRVTGCSGGHLSDIIKIIRNGLATGDNEAGQPGFKCINYNMPLCPNPNFQLWDCPNSFFRKWRKFTVPPVRDEDRLCDDGTNATVYGKGFAVDTLHPHQRPVPEEDIQHQIMKTGIVIATYRAGRNYGEFGKDPEMKGKVFTAIDKPGKEANHYLLITGWGPKEENSPLENYWEVKNNWGMDFGTDGYTFIKRGVNLNLIESEITYYWTPGECDDLRTVRIRKHLFINRQRTSCHADGWQDCPDGCIPYNYRYSLLDYFCEQGGKVIATTMRTKITVRCIAV